MNKIIRGNNMGRRNLDINSVKEAIFNLGDSISFERKIVFYFETQTSKKEKLFMLRLI